MYLSLMFTKGQLHTQITLNCKQLSNTGVRHWRPGGIYWLIWGRWYVFRIISRLCDYWWITNDNWLANILLSFGTKCRTVYPKWFRLVNKEFKKTWTLFIQWGVKNILWIVCKILSVSSRPKSRITFWDKLSSGCSFNSHSFFSVTYM